MRAVSLRNRARKLHSAKKKRQLSQFVNTELGVPWDSKSSAAGLTKAIEESLELERYTYDGPAIMWTGSKCMEPSKELLEAAIWAAGEVKEFSIVIPKCAIKDEDLEAMRKTLLPGCVRVLTGDVSTTSIVECVL